MKALIDFYSDWIVLICSCITVICNCYVMYHLYRDRKDRVDEWWKRADESLTNI